MNSQRGSVLVQGVQLSRGATESFVTHYAVECYAMSASACQARNPLGLASNVLVFDASCA